jgi:hypothetical protein
MYRTELLNTMGRFGIPKKLVRLVEITMKDSDVKITIGRNVSKSFNVLQGVRQGGGLSAVLFNLAVDEVLKGLKLNGNILYNSKQACAYLCCRHSPYSKKYTSTTYKKFE